MKHFYITFRSVTHAQTGERILRGAGIRGVLLRTPRWMEQKGCGYCLRLRAGDPRQVLQLLQREGAALGKLYVEKPEGGLEEWML